MGVGPMNLVITNDALYQLSYTSAATLIIANGTEECKCFFQKNKNYSFIAFFSYKILSPAMRISGSWWKPCRQ